jgi:hypothetical protein
MGTDRSTHEDCRDVGGCGPACPLCAYPEAGIALDGAARFNEQYPVGTPVRYWPAFRQGAGRESVTRTLAWLVGGHTPCVSVEGYPGGIALTHVQVTPGA